MSERGQRAQQIGADTSWLDEQREFRDVELEHPIRAHGREVRSVRILEPVAKDLRVGKQGRDDDEMRAQLILASCCKLPIYSIGMLRLGDYQRCVEALAELGFTELAEDDTPAPEAGSTGSPPIGKTD